MLRGAWADTKFFHAAVIDFLSLRSFSWFSLSLPPKTEVASDATDSTSSGVDLLFLGISRQSVVEGDVENWRRTAENGGFEGASKGGRRSCRRRVWAEPHHRNHVDEEPDASTRVEDGFEAYGALEKSF